MFDLAAYKTASETKLQSFVGFCGLLKNVIETN